MKIKIQVDDLASQLKKFDLLKQTYSYLSECVCVTTGEDKITLSATDGLICVSTIIDCLVDEPGTLTITCKQLSKLLEVLPANEVELTVLENKLQVKTVTGEYLLNTINLDNKIERNFVITTQLNVESKILLDGIAGTLFSVSTDDTKQQLCGVNLQTKGKTNKFCATNAHTLSLYEVDGEITNPDSNFLLTNKICKLLPKFLTAGEKVNIALGKESYIDINSEETISYEAVVLTFGNTTIKYSLRCIGMFPQYDQIIPRQSERKVLVERQTLISAVESIAVIAQQKNNTVKLSISCDRQELRVSCECQDVGASETAVPAQISGDSLVFAFNLDYFLGGLRSFSSTEVAMNINQVLTPVIIEPLSVQKHKFLIMPVQLRG